MSGEHLTGQVCEHGQLQRQCYIRELEDTVQGLKADLMARAALIRDLDEQIKRLRRICRNAYEVYAGSEGVSDPATAKEAYLIRLLMDMTKEISRGLK
jgi:hypothetical protein